MKIHPSIQKTLLCAIAALFCGCATAESDPAASTEEQANGLWYYTGLATGDGKEMPLTGVFLFKDGVFIQQAVFDGAPFEAQGSMAHAGPYRAGDGFIHLVAEQTISTAPTEQPALTSAGLTEHDVTVKRTGDEMALVFGMGTSTIQEFKYVGPGKGELHALKNGAMAFVDGHFVLVAGDGTGLASGYGTYTKSGDAVTVKVIRWTDVVGSKVSNYRDVTWQATFDGKTLTLADGRTFAVTPRK